MLLLLPLFSFSSAKKRSGEDRQCIEPQWHSGYYDYTDQLEKCTVAQVTVVYVSIIRALSARLIKASLKSSVLKSLATRMGEER